MKPKKKIVRLAYPIITIALGTVFIITQRGNDGVLIEAEGPMAVFVGVLLCLLGVWGLVRSLQEDRKKEEPPEPTHGTGP